MIDCKDSRQTANRLHTLVDGIETGLSALLVRAACTKPDMDRLLLAAGRETLPLYLAKL